MIFGVYLFVSSLILYLSRHTHTHNTHTTSSDTPIIHRCVLVHSLSLIHTFAFFIPWDTYTTEFFFSLCFLYSSFMLFSFILISLKFDFMSLHQHQHHFINIGYFTPHRSQFHLFDSAFSTISLSIFISFNDFPVTTSLSPCTKG